jgi:hypothetical protein
MRYLTGGHEDAMTTRRRTGAVAILVTAMAAAMPGAGHAYQLDRATFSGAAPNAVNGSVKLRGTLAEACVAGTAGGGGYTFHLGFWAPSVLSVTAVRPMDGTVVLADRLDAAFPNPFRQHATISFSLARPAAVRLSIYDVAGRRLATLAEGPLLAGEHRRVWDGRDDAGRAIAAGVYFYRLEAGSWNAAGRVLKLR